MVKLDFRFIPNQIVKVKATFYRLPFVKETGNSNFSLLKINK